MWGALVLTIVSLVDYVSKNRNVINDVKWKNPRIIRGLLLATKQNQECALR
jgi:hypothetical protein